MGDYGGRLASCYSLFCYSFLACFKLNKIPIKLMKFCFVNAELFTSFNLVNFIINMMNINIVSSFKAGNSVIPEILCA